MKITLKYDRELDAWTVEHQEARIRTRDDIAEWKRQLVAELKKLKGKKAWLLIDAAGFQLDSAVAAEYGAIAREVAEKYAHGVLRYGKADGWTAAQVRLQAVIQRFPANFFQDREAAVEALRRLKSQPVAAQAK